MSWMIAFLLLAVAPFGIASEGIDLGRSLKTGQGAVVCVERQGARIGAEVLADGGNAVDAAVAVGFALAVTHPAAGNLGGGGFMLVRMADGREAAIDYRETAPAAAHPGMFLDAKGNIDPDKAGIGHWVVGVPGTPAGLAMAHAMFGSLGWRRLLQPARTLAEEGIEVDAVLADGLCRYQENFAAYPGSARVFLQEDGTPFELGQVWRQPDLANTLRWLQEGGVEAFYRGPIAVLLAAEMRRGGGLLTEADLAAYEPIVRQPLRFLFRGYEVLAMPPPSSGGVALAQILGQMERGQLSPAEGRSALALHRLAEAQRRAFAQRAQYLGDPEATPVDVAGLIGVERIDALAASIEASASPSEEFGPPLTGGPPEGHTTHFSIVDRFGNAVSNTYTLEESYGSKVVAPGTGFLLNNELHDFNLRPGQTTRGGRIGTAPNLPRPGRRPLSSMSPCIVLEGGSVRLVTGSPGGRTIINTVACVLWNHLGATLDLEASVAAPRQHHQWFPDLLRIEGGIPLLVREELRARGHRLRVVETQGDAHSIARDTTSGRLHAVADRRIDGWVGAVRRVREDPDD